MKRVLLVDDDPTFVRIYKDGLSRLGLDVTAAEDGVAALTAMHRAKPDVVVLDLMMPRLSGQEVLKLMRERADLASIPVVVLSNSYMEEMTKLATAAGAVRSLLKIQSTPAILCELIAEVLDQPAPVESQGPPPKSPAEGTGTTATGSPGILPASPTGNASIPAGNPTPPAQAPSTAEPSPPHDSENIPVVSSARAAALAQSVSPFAAKLHEAQVRGQARDEFLSASASHCSSLRALFLAFANATDETRLFRLHDLYRKVHFLTGTAGFAECHHIAQMAAVFEAMLFQIMDQPSRITPSVLRTGAMAIDFVQMLFARAERSPGDVPLPQGRVLVVDDDPVCTRLVLWALQQAHLEARSARDTDQALQWLNTAQFDLVILDVGLPGMDGLEFCKLLRTFPTYKHVPIIHCTCHTDFGTRTQSALSGGDDFISKPVLPMELALKAVMQLIERQET